MNILFGSLSAGRSLLTLKFVVSPNITNLFPMKFILKAQNNVRLIHPDKVYYFRPHIRINIGGERS